MSYAIAIPTTNNKIASNALKPELSIFSPSFCRQKLGEKIDSSGLRALLAILLLVVGIAIAYDTFFAEQIQTEITSVSNSDLNFFSTFILEFSKDMPFFYGLFSILFAIFLGVAAAFIRRFVSNFKKKILIKS